MTGLCSKASQGQTRGGKGPSETGERQRLGYRTAQEAHRDISHYLMHRYNWIRPHQFNGGLAPARAEEKLNVVSGIS